MTPRWAFVAAAIGLIGCLIGLILAPRETLAAWLVCWLGLSAIPIGALALLMLVALIPGTWRQLYAGPLRIGAALMPLAAIAVLPMLIGIKLLYPWTDPAATAGYAAFKAAWLSTGFFIVRAIVYLAVLSGLGWALIAAEPRKPASIAAAGVLAYALIGSLIGIDFVESTEPAFHSSIYGLFALTNQWLAGTAFAILIGLWRTNAPAPRAAAGVLITVILLWGYMHAMQYIVIWSGDIPREVRWYLERGDGLWGLLAWAVFGLQFFVPFAAMLSPAVRTSRPGMMALAGLTLAMRIGENAWLVLPGLHGIGWAVAPLVAAAAAAMVGTAVLSAGALRSRACEWDESGWIEQTRSV